MNIFIPFIFSIVSLQVFAQSNPEQFILDLSKKKFEWMTTQNFDSLESVLDNRLEFVHSSGWTENKQEFIADIKSKKLLYNSIAVTESSARVYTNSAVVIGRGKFSVRLDGKDMEFDLKYTEVYVLQQGKWVLASRHANRMQ